MSNIHQIMTKLAETVGAKASLADTPLADATDALKALTAYYTVLLKQKADREDDGTPSFLDFQASLTEPEVPRGGEVRGGKRRRAQ